MILYSVVARSNDGTILAEATTAGVEGNHAQVTSQLIHALVNDPSLLPAVGNRKTFATNTNNTHSSSTSTAPLKTTENTSSKSRSKAKKSSNSGLFAASSWFSGNSEDDGGDDSYYRHTGGESTNSYWGNSTDDSQSEGMAVPAGGTTSTSMETYFHVLRGEDILVLGLSDDLDGQGRRA